jgi:hypothetical protein
MRAVTVIGVLLVGGAATASAQHAHQLEFGGFGVYTRYDEQYQLENQLGGGARLGFFFNESISLELDASLARPAAKPGVPVLVPTTQARWGSVSLVLNSGGQHNILYILGGYSRLDMGVNPPYAFANHAIHAGLGDRIFIGDRLALRLEARAFYVPNSCCMSTKYVAHIQGSAGLSYFLFGGGPREEAPPPIPKERRDSIIAQGGKVPEPPRRAGGPSYEHRSSDWTHKWYWGAQGGLMVFRTNSDGISFEPTFGGHWLITGKRTALFVGYEQSFFLAERHTTFVEPNGSVSPGNVSFKDLRRIMIGALAFPAQKRVEPFGGIGFAIMEALNVQENCVSCTTASEFAQMQDAADQAASKAFFFWMGGIDIKQGRLALYGHYILTSSARGFIIDGTTHTFQGGIRYSLGTAKEGITER